jgi:hypothetical protein
LALAGTAQAKTKDTGDEPLSASLPAYAAFHADIGLVNGGSIKDPKDIERALDKAAALNRDAMTRGIMAYGALTAARNSTFVGEVRKISAYYGREKTVQGFINSSRYATGLPGASEAISSIVLQSKADSSRITAAGENVKQRAREAQNLSWGKANAGAAKPRMERLKALAAATQPGTVSPDVAGRLTVNVGSGGVIDPTSFGGTSFWTALNAPASATADATLVSLPVAAPVYSNNAGGSDIRAKMLTLAALYSLGATNDQPAETERLLNDNLTNGCLQGAQLQFYQCVASAKFNYENMACIGEAGLITVGQCVGDIAK